MQIVDIHPHVISPDGVRYPRRPLSGKQSEWSRARQVTCEGLQAAMDDAGIAGAVVVNASSVYGFDNTYVADSVASHSSRIAGVGSIDVLAPDGADRASYWVERRGLAGLRVYAAGSQLADDSSSWIVDPRTFPVWERICALGVPVCILLRFKGLPPLARLLGRFPSLRIVLDHFAHPPLSGAPDFTAMQPLLDLARSPNLFLKLSAPVFRDVDDAHIAFRPFFARIVEAFGARRIAWGSNFPASPGTLTELLERARAELAFLSTEEQEAIFGGTARSLYPAISA